MATSRAYEFGKFGPSSRRGLPHESLVGCHNEAIRAKSTPIRRLLRVAHQDAHRLPDFAASGDDPFGGGSNTRICRSVRAHSYSEIAAADEDAVQTFDRDYFVNDAECFWILDARVGFVVHIKFLKYGRYWSTR
jgi:hypothetical protein